MPLRYLLLLAILVPANASAAPVYLQCQVSSPKDAQKIWVVLDEATGKVTHKDDAGLTFNSDGFFTASEVSYQRIVPGRIRETRAYTIDRVSLAMKFMFKVEASDSKLGIAPSVISYTGTCTLEAPPAERKF